MTEGRVILLMMDTCRCKPAQLIPGTSEMPEHYELTATGSDCEYFELASIAARRFVQRTEDGDEGWAVHLNGHHIVGVEVDRKRYGALNGHTG